MSFDGCFLLGNFDCGESAEQKVIVTLVGSKEVLVLRNIELTLQTSLVRLRFQVLFIVLNSGGKLMAGESAFDLSVLDELEMFAILDQLL